MGNGPADFTVSGDPGEDEMLPGSDRPTSPRRRLRADIAVGIVVLGGAYLIARALSHGNSTHPAPSPSTTPRSTATVPLTGPPPRGVFTFGPSNQVGVDAIADPPPCPRTARGAAGCTTSHAVPPGVIAAVHRVLKGIVVSDVATATWRSNGTGIASGIWSRTISAHDVTTYLVAVVSENGPSGNSAVRGEANGTSTIFARAHQGPYTVQIQVIVTGRGGPSAAEVASLAADPRLVRRG